MGLPSADDDLMIAVQCENDCNHFTERVRNQIRICTQGGRWLDQFGTSSSNDLSLLSGGGGTCGEAKSFPNASINPS